MRLIYIFAALLGLSIALIDRSEASEAKIEQKEPQQVCRVETGDIGTIIARGPAAFEDAATQCFDRRMQLHKVRHGKPADMETGELFIDLCANIKCEKEK